MKINFPPPRNELSNVDVEIACLNRTLFSPIFSPPITLTQKYTPHMTPIRTSRFSKLTSVLSISREDPYKRENAKLGGKWGWGRYNRLDKNEETPLIRRESGVSGRSSDSDRTLVGATANCGENICLVQDEWVHDPADELLVLLAPVISTIQRMGIKISSRVHALLPAEYDVLRDHYLEACNAMLSALNKLQSPQSYVKARRSSFVDTEDDLEMRTLILEALIKKIKAEQARFRFLPTTLISSHNPFVVHAAASLQNPDQRPSGRRASTVQSNPITIVPAQVTLPNGEISSRSFIRSPQQSSWAMNIVRLGSFQASALFTPSPIAVRKPVEDAGKV